MNKELRQDANEQDGMTRHIEFDLSKSPLRWQTADNLGVYPRNDYKQAFALAKRLNVDWNAKFTLKKKGISTLFISSPVSATPTYSQSSPVH